MVYRQNFADIIFWQHCKICQSISSLRGSAVLC